MHKTQEEIIKIARQGIGINSMRILGKLVGVDHPQKIKHHLDQLEKKNILKYDSKSGRLILLSSNEDFKSDIISIPIYGAANCGEALKFADDYIEGYIKVSKNLLYKTQNIFVLKSSGDSMNKTDIHGKNIEDGDYVLIDADYKTPKTGDRIVSVIDGLANIKKYIRDDQNKQIVLMPESTKDYAPIFIGIDELGKYTICGKVIQVIKKPKLN